MTSLIGLRSVTLFSPPQQELVLTYQETCTTVISQYEGHIAQYLGEGLLVYFGYPTAHEDDAARARRRRLNLVLS